MSLLSLIGLMGNKNENAGANNTGIPDSSTDGTQSDPMSRAYTSRSQEPSYMVDQGLMHLKDPAVANSMPYEQYMSLVTPLLQAKHGMGGAGVGPSQGGQGSIKSGQMGGGGFGLSGVMGLMSLLKGSKKSGGA